LVLDGELTVPIDGVLSFDALQARVHPAASRIARLARETPSQLILFDCLATQRDGVLLDAPLHRRRAVLETVFKTLKPASRFRLSPSTTDGAEAQAWLDRSHGDVDGVVAKRDDGAYVPGERAMLKIKHLRTADCVVGGFRYASDSREVGSLLLGLYNDAGKLDHVGYTSALSAEERAVLTPALQKLIEPPGFSGDSPGGPSRWSNARSAEWQPLRPALVVEVRYDHVSGGRFRHGTRLLRWRTDKSPQQCRSGQLEQPKPP
jgi:ATP-dependent DNA ligase